MVSNNRRAHSNQHAHSLRNVLGVASSAAVISDDRRGAARSAIHARLLSGASSLALSVASMVVALGVCAPDKVQAQTQVNPQNQTNTFTLNFGQNPIVFIGGSSINTIAAATDAIFGDTNTKWTVTNRGTIKGGFTWNF